MGLGEIWTCLSSRDGTNGHRWNGNDTRAYCGNINIHGKNKDNMPGWTATLGKHEAVEKNKQMENTTTWFGKNLEWTGRKRAAMLPKDRRGTTSALERNSAGSIVMVKTLDEILRASKRRVNVGCGAHTLVKSGKNPSADEDL